MLTSTNDKAPGVLPGAFSTGGPGDVSPHGGACGSSVPPMG
nr:hypothetical protein OG409_23155 [Streptomyces sp. NBC_00974]